MTTHPKDRITYGASDEGYRYAELMFVAFATAVHIATATPRFALGLGIVDEIHARISWKMEKEPIAWRNIACTSAESASVLLWVSKRLTKYRAPKLCVVVDRICPTTEMAAPTQMWKQRS